MILLLNALTDLTTKSTVTDFHNLCTCHRVVMYGKLTGAPISRVLSARPLRYTAESKGRRRGLQG